MLIDPNSFGPAAGDNGPACNSCNSCKYFDRIPARDGERIDSCRFEPKVIVLNIPVVHPITQQVGMRTEIRTTWATVNPEIDWCSHYDPRITLQ